MSNLTDIADTLKGIKENDEIIVNHLNDFAPSLSATSASSITAIASSIFSIISELSESLNSFLQDLATRRLQDEENRRELLEALRESNSRPGPSPSSNDDRRARPPSIDFSSRLMGLSALLGTIYGFTAEISNSLSFIPKRMKAIVNGIKGISKWLMKYADFGPMFADSLHHSMRNVLAFWKKLTKPIRNLSRFLRGTTSIVSNIAAIPNAIKGIFIGLKDAYPALKAAMKWGSKLGRLLSGVAKLFGWVIFVGWSAYLGIVEAMKKFKENDVIGGIMGFIKVFTTSFFTEMLDFFKDITSWIVNKFGFEKISKWLDSFSITDITKTGLTLVENMLSFIRDSILDMFSAEKLQAAYERLGAGGIGLSLIGSILDAVVGAIKWIITAIGGVLDNYFGIDLSKIINYFDRLNFRDMFLNMAGVFSDFVSNSVEAITTFFTNFPNKMSDIFASVGNITKDFAKSVLQSVLPRKEDHKSLFDPLHWVGKAIPDSVYTFAELDKPSATKAKYDKQLAYDKDSSGELSDTEFLEYLKGEKQKGSLNGNDYDFTGGINIAKQRIDPSADVLSYISSGSSVGPLETARILTPKQATDTPASVLDYISSTPSTKGSLLNSMTSQASQAPVIINSGGNVSNTNNSNISNNSPQFDLISPGSSMSF